MGATYRRVAFGASIALAACQRGADSLSNRVFAAGARQVAFLGDSGGNLSGALLESVALNLERHDWARFGREGL